jgi:hypothetical protein
MLFFSAKRSESSPAFGTLAPSMARRREEKERLRRQRLEAERREAADARRRLLLGYLVAGLLGAAVVTGLVVVVVSGDGGSGGEEGPENAHIVPETGTTQGLEPDGREAATPPAVEQADLEEAAEIAGCDLQLDLPDEGAQHLSPAANPPDYRTNPPTSGDHAPDPIADGAYLTIPEPVNFVHTLEHGRVEIQYDPDLPEDSQLLLKGVFEESPAGMLMFPNPDMPYEVAATAWTNLLGCKRFDERVVDAIRAFRDTYRGQGPEPVPF